MTRTVIRHALFAAISVLAVVLLCSCGTTGGPRVTRHLPPFEPPIAKADFQTVRTTAYTHTESDHLAYGNRNALGGQLHAASAPGGRAEYVPRALPFTADANINYQFAASTKRATTDNDDEDEPAPKAKATKSKSKKPEASDDEDKPVRKATAVKTSAKSSKSAKKKTDDDEDDSVPKAKAVSATKSKTVKRAIAVDADDDKPAKPSKQKSALAKAEKSKTRDVKVKGAKRAIAVKKPKAPVIGSAAADWARWPVGTTFRLLSTGQIYRVDDTGWALAGRNTIDLYMATPRDMNSWGARDEKIQILHWGDPEESARLLASRQDYKHARRMLLEISGRYDEAAQLQ